MCRQLWSRRPCVLVLAIALAGPWPGSASAGYVGWDQAGPTSDVRMNADAELTKTYSIKTLWMDAGAERLYGNGSLNLLGGKLISSGERQEISLPFLNTSPRGDLDLQVTTSGELTLAGTIGARDIIKDGAGRLTLGILPTSPLQNLYIKEGVLSATAPAALDAADRVIFSAGTTFAPAAGINRPFETTGGQVNIIGPPTVTADIAASGTGGLTILRGKVGLSGNFVGDTIIRGGEVNVIRPVFQGRFIVEGGFLSGSVVDQPVVVPGAARLSGGFRSPMQFGAESSPAVVTIVQQSKLEPIDTWFEGPLSGRVIKMGDGTLRLNSPACAADIEVTDGKVVLDQSMQGTLTASISSSAARPIILEPPLPNPVLQISVETGAQPVSIGSLVLRGDLGIGGKSDLTVNGPTELQAGNRMVQASVPKVVFAGPLRNGRLTAHGGTFEFRAAGAYPGAEIYASYGSLVFNAEAPIAPDAIVVIGPSSFLAGKKPQWIDCEVVTYGPLAIGIGGDRYFTDAPQPLRISRLTTGPLMVNSGLRVDELTLMPTSPSRYLEKRGKGTLRIEGGDAGQKIEVLEGTLVVNGRVMHRDPVQVKTGATLGGHGWLGAVTGAGTITPGNEAWADGSSWQGILSVEKIYPSQDMNYRFQFTATTPDYTDRAYSLNDLLVLEGTSPFGFVMPGQSTAKVYLNMEVHNGDVIKGGFYARYLNAAGLESYLDKIVFEIYAKKGPGSYELLPPSRYVVGAIDEPVSSIDPFFSWNGSVATFTIVPEPSAGLLMFVAAAMLAHRRHDG